MGPMTASIQNGGVTPIYLGSQAGRQEETKQRRMRPCVVFYQMSLGLGLPHDLGVTFGALSHDEESRMHALLA